MWRLCLSFHNCGLPSHFGGPTDWCLQPPNCVLHLRRQIQCWSADGHYQYIPEFINSQPLHVRNSPWKFYMLIDKSSSRLVHNSIRTKDPKPNTYRSTNRTIEMYSRTFLNDSFHQKLVFITKRQHNVVLTPEPYIRSWRRFNILEYFQNIRCSNNLQSILPCE